MNLNNNSNNYKFKIHLLGHGTGEIFKLNFDIYICTIT